MKKLDHEQEFTTFITSSQLRMVIFKTTWCPDCHYIELFMPQLLKSYADSMEFAEVDRDQLPEVFEKWTVMGIPSFIAFKDGQEIMRFVSKLRKTREEITTFIERAIQVGEAIS